MKKTTKKTRRPKSRMRSLKQRKVTAAELVETRKEMYEAFGLIHNDLGKLASMGGRVVYLEGVAKDVVGDKGRLAVITIAHDELRQRVGHLENVERVYQKRLQTLEGSHADLIRSLARDLVTLATALGIELGMSGGGVS